MDFSGSYILKRKPMMDEKSSSSDNSLDYKVAHCGKELMLAAVSFHQLHLKVTGTGSYAAHKALNELYDALPDHADSLIEGYQGAAEVICQCDEEMSPKVLNSVEDSLSYIRELTGRVTELQGMIPYSEIVNDLDTLKSTLNSAKYKLKFLQ